ncbi:MAG: dipeptide epimerase [Pseudomonadota bacterium]
MQITFQPVTFDLKRSFAITGRVRYTSDTIHVTITDGTFQGRGEASGVYYLGETISTMREQLEDFCAEGFLDLNTRSLQELLPPGGARNALDCALWDLKAKSLGRPIWSLVDMIPRRLPTVLTIGICDLDEIEERARESSSIKNLKIKLNADRPVERIEIIREVRPDAVIVVDVNQGWSIDELKEYAPTFKALGVAMIEQPIKRGDDDSLAGFDSPVPLAADESCLHSKEFESVRPYYDIFNIKLDKTGGLTEALRFADLVKRHGKRLMVGNMGGSSLAMAPSYVVGQHCTYVDIDGPLLIKRDVPDGLCYEDKDRVGLPSTQLWG